MNRLVSACPSLVFTVAGQPLPAEQTAICLVDEGQPRATIVIAKGGAVQ